MTIYGYARVSTDGQSLDAQVKQLRAAGAEKVFRETACGAKTDRAQIARCNDTLTPIAMARGVLISRPR
jgi:DNA invertase Pin-like site-specific DNA recombinase